VRLVFGHDEAIAEWVSRRIPHMAGGEFKDFAAIGVADGNRPIAGIVYNEFYPAYGTMQVSMAADTPRWAQRGIIRAALHYPFEQRGVKKLWSAMPVGNKRAIKFNLGIGFIQEAVLGHHFGDQHAVITRMYLKDYQKLYQKEHENGQVLAVATRRA